jgi:hypothetical protein
MFNLLITFVFVGEILHFPKKQKLEINAKKYAICRNVYKSRKLII